MKTMYDIIHETWEEGGEQNKKKLSKYRLIIDDFTALCMKKWEKEIKGKL